MDGVHDPVAIVGAHDGERGITLTRFAPSKMVSASSHLRFYQSADRDHFGNASGV